MISVRKYIVFLICLAGLGSSAMVGCGSGGSGPDPEQTARRLFELEWNNNIEEAWNLFHSLWKKNGYDESFARYANAMEEKNTAWAGHPRTISRCKTFSGDRIPIVAQKFVAALGRDTYDFSVVRIAIDYPQVPGYRGGVVDYLITLAKKKEHGSRWQIISRSDKADVPGFFDW